MYQKVVLVGRITKDIDLKMAAGSGMAIAKFSIAIDRQVKKGEDKKSDFLNVVAFGKTAEFVSQYSDKGKLILVDGRIQTGHYENKDGIRVNTFDIIANEIKVIEWADKQNTGYSDMTPIVDDGLIPF